MKNHILLPQKQNSTQRKGFAITLILMVFLVFLHNPLDGYRIDESSIRFKEDRNPKCSKQEFKDRIKFEYQSKWPLNKWNEFADADPLPVNIDKWSDAKIYEWRNDFAVKAAKLNEKCITLLTYYDEETLPFSEWESKSPMIFWFGSVIHILGALFFVAVAGVIWLFVFQTNRD